MQSHAPARSPASAMARQMRPLGIFRGVIEQAPRSDATDDAQGANMPRVRDRSGHGEWSPARQPEDRVCVKAELCGHGSRIPANAEETGLSDRRRAAIPGPIDRQKPHTGRDRRIVTPRRHDPGLRSAGLHDHRPPVRVAAVPILHDSSVGEHDASVPTRSRHGGRLHGGAVEVRRRCPRRQGKPDERRADDLRVEQCRLVRGDLPFARTCGRDRRRHLDLAGHCAALLLERRDPDAIEAGSPDRSADGPRGRPAAGDGR